ncbi:serine hydrolase domain-containing protein [Aliiruegeria lutimaris]|uniref:CubicO group peptidase, beta-lactamase class C family n=1 Tax=Aliiruegeria lutimaris TaxID=571298 RepID=A0A1G8YAU7_9RHOB|nr:serine hydrolase domain-containing protein [Aliiruegeria lutimaris]SDJ99534.1 CubicO group peptidase, beta-lactamase class C family [Aliiruegeria lutimaris]
MFERLKERLEGAVSEGGFLGGGICLIDRDGREQAHVTGRIHPDRPATGSNALADPGMRLRMASISKAATARVACALAVCGMLDLDSEVAGLLEGDPGTLPGVTVRMLLNHTSGLTDAAGYIFERPLSPMAFVAANAGAVVSANAPGSWFRYCNLNYVLLGAVLEAVTRRRFDTLAREFVLAPAGIGGGFNWAGVPAAERARRVPLYQWRGAGFEPQTEPEAADWSADIVWGDGRGFSFADYVLQRDTLLISPHAGLRMSVIEAARLARLLGDDSPAGALQRATGWKFTPEAPNGNDCDGHFGEFGLGLTIYRSEKRIPGPLIGHAGHALGFTGGVWFNEDTGVSAGLFLTGSADLTDGLEDEVFYGPEELSLLQVL